MNGVTKFCISSWTATSGPKGVKRTSKLRMQLKLEALTLLPNLSPETVSNGSRKGRAQKEKIAHGSTQRRDVESERARANEKVKANAKRAEIDPSLVEEIGAEGGKNLHVIDRRKLETLEQ